MSESEYVELRQFGSSWSDSIPDDSSINVNIMTVTGDDGVIDLYPSVGFGDNFIYYTPQLSDRARLLADLLLPMTDVIDAHYRSSVKVAPNELVEHTLTVRKGAGNIINSIQRGALVAADNRGFSIEQTRARVGLWHQDFASTDDWSLFQMSQGSPGEVLVGSDVDSLLRESVGPWVIDNWLNEHAEGREWAPSKPALTSIAGAAFLGLRLARDAAFRLHALRPGVEVHRLEADTLYEMDVDCVHRMPAHTISSERAFFRDIVTRPIDANGDPASVEEFYEKLHPAETATLVGRDVYS